MDPPTTEEPPTSEGPTGPLADQPPVIRRGLIGLAVVLSAFGLAGAALSPYLLVKHPLALVALSPDGRHLLLVASQVDLATLLAVAVPRRALALLATYGVGGVYGYRFLRYAEGRLPRLARAARWLSGVVERAGPLLILFLPLHSLTALGAAAGLRFRTFLLVLLPAQIPFVVVHYYFGGAISGLTERLIAFLSAHLVESTLVCTALVGLQQLVSRLRRYRVSARSR